MRKIALAALAAMGIRTRGYGSLGGAYWYWYRHL